MYKRASNNSNNNNQTRICHVTCKPHDLTIACVCLQQRTLGRAVFSRCAFRAHIARSVTTRCLVCRDSVLTSFTVNAFPARLRWTLVWETIFAIGSGLFIRRCRVECKRRALYAAGFLHIRVSVGANGRVCWHALSWIDRSVNQLSRVLYQPFEVFLTPLFFCTLPAGQKRHDICASIGPYLPAGHSVHEVAPSLGPYLPVGHLVHCSINDTPRAE